MRISYLTIARSKGGAMEVGVHSGAHFQVVTPDSAQVE
jgi:hypothetical protein